jgi:VanZ family protein
LLINLWRTRGLPRRLVSMVLFTGVLCKMSSDVHRMAQPGRMRSKAVGSAMGAVCAGIGICQWFGDLHAFKRKGER